MLAVTACAAGRVDALCGQPYRLMDLPVMSELQDTLRNMGFVQLLLAFVFLTGYALALSSLTGALGRKRAGIVALLAALAFVATTQPWVHGVLLMVFAVAGLGLFMGTAWLLSRLFGLAAGRQQEPEIAAAEPAGQLDSPLDYPGHALTPSHAEGTSTH